MLSIHQKERRKSLGCALYIEKYGTSSFPLSAPHPPPPTPRSRTPLSSTQQFTTAQHDLRMRKEPSHCTRTATCCTTPLYDHAGALGTYGASVSVSALPVITFPCRSPAMRSIRRHVDTRSTGVETHGAKFPVRTQLSAWLGWFTLRNCFVIAAVNFRTAVNEEARNLVET